MNAMKAKEVRTIIGIIGNVLSFLISLSQIILVTTSNGTSLVIEVIYVVVFFIYCNDESRIQTTGICLIFEVMIVAILYSYTLLSIEHLPARRTFIGVVCNVFTIFMHASLVMMDTMLETSGCRYMMPFWLSFLSFINASIWTAYSLFYKIDIYILVINGLGTLVCACQLIVQYACYYTITDAIREIEEGHQTQPRWHQPQPGRHQPIVEEKNSGSKRQALKEFRILVKSYLETNPNFESSIWGIPLLDGEGSRMVLLKFLKAKNFNAEKSLSLLENTMEWRRNNNIDVEIEGRMNVSEEFVFMHGHDREGNPVCYDLVYDGFERVHFSDERTAEHHVASFVKTRILFMEKCIRKQYLTSRRIPSFLHVLDISSNPGGLSKRELDLVTELVKPALILAQEYYPGFAFKQHNFWLQIFIMEECPWWVRACNNMRARGAKEVEVAYPATSVCTLFRHIDPHQIPFKFGGLSILPTDISVGHNSSMLALKPGEDKSIEITCEQACTVHFLFRSSGVPLSYQISLIPGTFEWIKEDQTTFVPTGDDGALIRFERRWAYCGGLTTEVVKVKRPIKVVCSIRNSIDQESSFFLFKYHVVF